MYLREMGSVELLSREGEIAIAKRIEAGRDMMIGGICESPLTVRALMLWRDALNENKMLLRDIIDLDATYGSAILDRGRGGDGRRWPPRPRKPRRRRRPRPRRPRPRLAEAETEGEGEDGEGEESSISLAAMEAQLKPGMVAIFDAIAEAHKKIHKVQDQRITALIKGTALPRATERRYDKLKAEIVELLKRVRFNNTRIEHLVEQLYDLNRRLVTEEGRLLRLAESAGVKRAEFLQHYIGDELAADWLERVARAARPRLGAPRRAPRRRRRQAPRRDRADRRRSQTADLRIPPRRADRAARRARGRAAPRRRWSRPICGSSSRSPRNTPTAACNSST